MIKNFNQFIKEAYTIDNNDAPEVASDKNSFNKSENDVKEFLSKKTTIDNIYATYIDDKDLVTKLFAQKFIPQNTGDKTKIQFTNPLIGLYAQGSEKKRELNSLEANLKTQTDTLSQRKTDILQNPDNAESLNSDIDYTQSKISDINKNITTLKAEITNLEKSTNDKLNQMKTDILNNKKRIDTEIQ